MPSITNPGQKSSSPQPPAPSSRAAFWEGLPSTTREFLQGQGVEASTFEGAPQNRQERRAEASGHRASPRVVEAPRPAQRRRGRRRDAERRERRSSAERDRRHIERVRERLVREGGHDVPPPDQLIGIPSHVWKMCAVILADPSGRAIRGYARKFGNKVAVGAVMAAALVPGDGTQRYTWLDERARYIVALGFALIELSRATKKRGPYTRLVMGIPMGALRALVANPWDRERKPSRSAMAGTHREGGCMEDGQVGYMKALREAGLFYAQQVPREHAHSFERCGPSGHTLNRYWLVGMFPDLCRSLERAHKHIRLATFAWDVVDGKTAPRADRAHSASAIARRDQPPDG